jgi:hypothetical protein
MWLCCHGATLPRCQVPHCHVATLPCCQISRLPECHMSTLPRCYCAMLPCCHGVTVPCYHDVTLPRHHIAMLPRCHAATLPRCHQEVCQSIYFQSSEIRKSRRQRKGQKSSNRQPRISKTVFHWLSRRDAKTRQVRSPCRWPLGLAGIRSP